MIAPITMFRSFSLNRKLLSTLGVLLSLMFGAAPVHASEAESALRSFVEDVRTFSANYEQVQTDDSGEVLQRSSGRMALSRPGKFRWTYDTPYEQLMVCDGESIWVYDPDLAQVTRRPAEAALTGTPAALLAQRASLSDSFTIEDGGRSDGLQGVRLLPVQADSDFKSIELWLRDGAPVRMRFHDQLGGQTEVRFTQLSVNQAIDAAQFQLTPPAGAEVVDAG